MKNLKDPAFLLSAANSIAIIGGGLWLYKLNAETVAEFQKLKLAIETFLKQQGMSMSNEFKMLKSSMDDFDNRMKEIDKESSDKVKHIEYLIECVDALQKQTSTAEKPIVLPRPPRRRKQSRPSSKSKKSRRQDSKKKSTGSNESSSSSQSSHRSRRRRYYSSSDSSSSDSSDSESSSSSSSEDELSEEAIQNEIKKNRDRRNKHRDDRRDNKSNRKH